MAHHQFASFLPRPEPQPTLENRTPLWCHGLNPSPAARVLLLLARVAAANRIRLFANIPPYRVARTPLLLVIWPGEEQKNPSYPSVGPGLTLATPQALRYLVF